MCEVIEKERISWTNEKREELFNLWAEGKSAPQIAKMLDISVSAIYSQAVLLGITFHRKDSVGSKRKNKGKLRSCLCCKRKFFSEGPHNRLCEGCKSNNDLMSGY